MSLKKLPFEFHNFEQIIRLIKNFFENRRIFLKPYVLNFPKLNQSIKWRYDYILAIKKRVMDDLLDRFYEDLDYKVKRRFKGYYVKVSLLKY